MHINEPNGNLVLFYNIIKHLYNTQVIKFKERCVCSDEICFYSKDIADLKCLFAPQHISEVVPPLQRLETSCFPSYILFHHTHILLGLNILQEKIKKQLISFFIGLYYI